jgi:hypothetical protein
MITLKFIVFLLTGLSVANEKSVEETAKKKRTPNAGV